MQTVDKLTQPERKFYPKLFEELERNRFNKPCRFPTTVILGSGVSFYEGGCSSFGDIARYAIDREMAEPGTRQRDRDEKEFSRVLEDIGPVGRYALFRSHLVPAQDHRLYANLAKLLRFGFIHIVLTTNVDCCVENALARSGMPAEAFQVFEIGLRNCTRRYAQLLADNLRQWEPPVKIIKLHGSLNIHNNMAWSRDVKHIHDFLRKHDLLARALRGPVIVVGHSLIDKTVKQLLMDAFKFRGDDIKPVWIVDKKNVLAKKKGLAKMLRGRNGDDLKRFTLFDDDRGTADMLFWRLRKKLIRLLGPPILFDPRKKRHVSKEAKEAYPKGIRSLWANIDSVPYLSKAKNLLFTWDALSGDTDMVIPFYLIYPRDGKLWRFLTRKQIKIELPREGRREYKLALGPELRATERWLRAIHRGKLNEEHDKRLRPKGKEWNEHRIRFTSLKVKGNRFVFTAQKVRYLLYCSTNVVLGEKEVETNWGLGFPVTGMGTVPVMSLGLYPSRPAPFPLYSFFSWA
jgi:hypothetical protein